MGIPLVVFCRWTGSRYLSQISTGLTTQNASASGLEPGLLASDELSGAD
jgi:hypothetical protein